jgi:hypothetical protein
MSLIAGVISHYLYYFPYWHNLNLLDRYVVMERVRYR